MRVIRIKQRTIYLTVSLMLICLLSTGLTIVPKAVDNESGREDTAKVTAAADAVDLPIIMYHSILKDPAGAGDYVISPDTLEADIKYLKENGYTFILSSDLIDFVYNKGSLPEKPILITFDDGYYNNYYYAWDILKKYNAKAIISPIGIQSAKFSESVDENPNYGHCSWDNLKEMYESGIFEIANHSYDMHEYGLRKGCKIIDCENTEDYKNFFVQDVIEAQEKLEKNVGCEVLAFTYPFGAFCSESEEYLHELGYKITYITEDRNNTVTRDPESLYKLKRYNRPAGISTEQFMQKIVPSE
ncbi:MAG: polysaccharide deacetylase family protein [Bacillota bacterium]|jgi:peptidoglycan/xylan/chitin deacetylase (PgdA/CDA1 family)